MSFELDSSKRAMRKEWAVRSFERDADAAFWLNGLEQRYRNLKVEAMTALDHSIALAVSYSEG